MHPWLLPNRTLSPSSATTLLLGWAAMFVGGWALFRPILLPSLTDILGAFTALQDQRFVEHLAVSYVTCAEALVLSLVVSLPLGYLCRVPVVRPVALAVARLRFLSPAVFYMVFIFATKGAHQLKLAMLVLGISTYLVASLVSLVSAVPDRSFDEARLLRMGEWEATWYVVVRGTLPAVIDIVRDNAAMAWAMLMMAEGFVRGEGGLGVLLLEQEKYQSLAGVYAIAIAIVVVGSMNDWGFKYLRATVCPYAEQR